MTGIARQFEPQITRSGGAPSKFRFTVRCSDCANTDTYEASRPTSYDAVRGYFKDRGWLLGRAASFDVCPACLARPRHAQEDATRRPAPRDQSLGQAGTGIRLTSWPDTWASRRSWQLRSSGPRKPNRPSPLPLRRRSQRGRRLTLSPEVEQTLSGMAADLKGLRSAVGAHGRSGEPAGGAWQPADRSPRPAAPCPRPIDRGPLGRTSAGRQCYPGTPASAATYDRSGFDGGG